MKIGSKMVGTLVAVLTCSGCANHHEDLLTFLKEHEHLATCLLYTSPSPRDRTRSRMPSSA